MHVGVLALDKCDQQVVMVVDISSHARLYKWCGVGNGKVQVTRWTDIYRLIGLAGKIFWWKMRKAESWK